MRSTRNRYRSPSLYLASAKIILEANDVIFAKVSACLNLNKEHIISAGRGHAMSDANADINRSACLECLSHAINGDNCWPLHDKPMLGALLVGLIGKARTRLDLNLFYSTRGHFTLAHTDASLRTMRWMPADNATSACTKFLCTR